MRVALLDPSNFSLPYDRMLGGALHAAGCDVELIHSAWTRGRPPQLEFGHREFFYRNTHKRFPQGGGKVYKMMKGAEHLRDLRRLRKELIATPPDLLHVQWVVEPTADRKLLWDGLKIPIVYTVHNLLPHDSGEEEAAKYRPLYDRARGLIAHTEATREALVEDWGIDGGKVAVIPHGHFGFLGQYRSDAGTAEWRERLAGGNPNALVLLLFGNLMRYKGLDVLIDALAEQVEPNVRLAVVGQVYDDMEYYRQRIAQAGLEEQIEFIIGYLPDEQVANVMHAADAVVLPYQRIEQSGVALTALGLGRPMLVSEVGGLSEVVEHGETGYVLPREDPTKWARAIRGLCEDRAQLQAMSRKAVKSARQRYGWDRIAEQTMAVYRDVLERFS